jgi:hypothetical protein
MPRQLKIAVSLLPAALAACSALAGCSALSRYGPSSQPIVPPPTIFVPGEVTGPPGSAPGEVVPEVVPPSTVSVPVTNPDWTWDQIVDIVDDYFQIASEDRVKQVGDVMTEGRIDTFPLTGATIFEPWRKDSVNLYERWECTLQSIQRRASIRVIPDATGYLVDVSVWKELEDVPKPIHANAGAATFRYDTSLQRDTEFDPDTNRIPGDPARPVGPRTPTIGWIYLGRDPALEQEICARIRAKLCGAPIGKVASLFGYKAPAPEPQEIPPGPLLAPPPAPENLPSPK